MDPKVFVKGEAKRIACSARECVNLVAHGFKEIQEKAEPVVEAVAEVFESTPYFEEQEAPEVEKPKRGPGRPRKND